MHALVAAEVAALVLLIIEENLFAEWVFVVTHTTLKQIVIQWSLLTGSITAATAIIMKQ